MRQAVAKRADCQSEYCHIHRDDAFYSFQIDHTISLKHGGETFLDNLAFSCLPCNLNKSSDVGTISPPRQIFIRLFNPRMDPWDKCFSVGSGKIYPETSIGEATIKVLKLNESERIIERQ